MNLIFIYTKTHHTGRGVLYDNIHEYTHAIEAYQRFYDVLKGKAENGDEMACVEGGEMLRMEACITHICMCISLSMSLSPHSFYHMTHFSI